MLRDLITGLAPNGLDQTLKVIASKQGGSSALLAQQEMLVPSRSRNKCLASLRLMHTLD
jgi:hypothetical protein